MNRSALRNMLKVVGIIMVVMLPVMLALWFAQLRAVSEISAQLRTFAELALNKTERVIQQVDLAREDAEKYQGKSVYAGASSIYVERFPRSSFCCRFNLC